MRVPNHVDCARSYARRRVGTELSLVTRAMTTCAAATRLRDRSPTASTRCRVLSRRGAHSGMSCSCSYRWLATPTALSYASVLPCVSRGSASDSNSGSGSSCKLQAASCIQTELILYLIL